MSYCSPALQLRAAFESHLEETRGQIERLEQAFELLGEKVRGKLFMIAVVAEGTDKYSVLYSLAEIDPSIHTGDILVPDSMDGQKLGKDGAFKMISTEEKRPARWVRNLAAISVIQVN